MKETFSTRNELSRSNPKYTTEPGENSLDFSVANQDQKCLSVFGSDSEADKENSEL